MKNISCIKTPKKFGVSFVILGAVLTTNGLTTYQLLKQNKQNEELIHIQKQLRRQEVQYKELQLNYIHICRMLRNSNNVF